MASDKRLDQVKLVNSAESVLVVNGDQVEKAALAGFANSMGSSVPLQQTSEQVSITGLYARTSDGKMVELTKESVASIVSELIGTATLSKDGLLKASQFIQVQASDYSLYKICSSNGKTWVRNNFVIKGSYNSVPFQYIGGVYYKDNIASPSVSIKSSYGEQSHIKFYNKNGDVYVFFNIPSTDLNYAWVSSSDEMFLSGVGNQSVIDSSYTEISPKIDVFGYNTLAELSSGVAEQMRTVLKIGTYFLKANTPFNTGIKEGGLYKFTIGSLTYGNPLYFIYTLNEGVTKLNATWYSDSETELAFSKNESSEMIITYNVDAQINIQRII